VVFQYGIINLMLTLLSQSGEKKEKSLLALGCKGKIS
jgi:hypothetical protein